MKLLIVTPVPSPYRIPLFNQINRQCTSRGWSLKVVFLTAGYERRKWKVDTSSFQFDHVVLENPNLASGESFFSLAASLPAILWQERPDKVLVAGFSLSAVWTMVFCSLFAIPFGVWSGETIAEERLRTGLTIRRWVRRIIARRSSFFVAYGSAAVRYLEGLGIDRSRAFVGINTVDTGYMETRTSELVPEREAWKSQNNLPAFNVLFVGYLEQRKGVRQLIDAFDVVSKSSTIPMGLHIVGSGTDEARLKEQVSSRSMKKVYFWGYRQQSELPRFFSMADVLVFPSLNELFGLVPIEAMAAGLPVLCSRYAGCADDLVLHGVNGWLIDPLNTADVADKIRMLCENSEVRIAMGNQAAQFVKKQFNLEVSARGFIRAFEVAGGS